MKEAMVAWATHVLTLLLFDYIKVNILIAIEKKGILFFLFIPLFFILLIRFVTIVWADFNFLPGARHFQVKGVGSCFLNISFTFLSFLFLLKIFLICLKFSLSLKLLFFLTSYSTLYVIFIFITFFHWYSCLWRENDPMGDIAHKRRKIYNFFYFLYFFTLLFKFEWYQTFLLCFVFFTFYYAFGYHLIYYPRKYLESPFIFNLRRFSFAFFFFIIFSFLIFGTYGFE